MIIDTKLDVTHLELIKVFLQANDLVGVEINQVPMEFNGKYHMVLQLDSKFEPTSEKITFMGLRNYGFQNMLDHYLLRCGVHVDKLQPESIRRQIQEEKQKKELDDFLLALPDIIKNKTTKEQNVDLNQ